MSIVHSVMYTSSQSPGSACLPCTLAWVQLLAPGSCLFWDSGGQQSLLESRYIRFSPMGCALAAIGRSSVLLARPAPPILVCPCLPANFVMGDTNFQPCFIWVASHGVCLQILLALAPMHCIFHHSLLHSRCAFSCFSEVTPCDVSGAQCFDCGGLLRVGVHSLAFLFLSIWSSRAYRCYSLLVLPSPLSLLGLLGHSFL